jgi:hypothetical protein
MKYRKRRSQYINLKTDEGIVVLAMIVFMVSSIIALLVGSITELYPSLPDGLPPSARIISVVLFSIGIILLIGKVYLHGKEID